mgnify:CR=1 FL=1
MKKRAAETLIEIITAMMIFGIIMGGFYRMGGGISDFIANQSIAVARRKDREKIIYYAQRWLASGDVRITEADGGKIKFSFADNVLTVAKGKTSMVFNLQ